jgi:hypothetical protein
MADVRRNDEAGRYELYIDGELVGIADFHEVGDRTVLPHTEINPSRRGQGLGDQLVGGALDDIRVRGGRVVPQCWFVDEFLQLHPDYADLRAS